MSLKASVRRAGDVAVVDLAGRITLGEGSGLLRTVIKDLINSGQKHILVNLRNVAYIDSSGLGELVGTYSTVTHANGIIKLLQPQEKVRDLLQVTRLQAVFTTFDDEIEALRSFAASSSAGRLFL
jgi:anti-sigma B factor antagonist